MNTEIRGKMERINRARRSGRVQRFHCYELINRQDVAQHTFNVMNLLMIMTGGTLSQPLLMAALLHDQGEYVTGDIPSPVKRAMGNGADPIRTMEEQAINMIHVAGPPDLSEWEALLLKVADNLDGLMTVIREYKRGNKDLMEVGNAYSSYLKENLTNLGGGCTGELVQAYVFIWENLK